MIDSIRSKLTAWYVSVLASVLIAFGVGIYVMLSQTLYERVDDSLRTLVDIATSSLAHEAEEGQPALEAAISTVSYREVSASGLPSQSVTIPPAASMIGICGRMS